MSSGSDLSCNSGFGRLPSLRLRLLQFTLAFSLFQSANAFGVIGDVHTILPTLTTITEPHHQDALVAASTTHAMTTISDCLSSAAASHDTITTSSTATASLLENTPSSLILSSFSSAPASPSFSVQMLYASYKQALTTNPLITKMITGASLAVLGDAIAQRCIGGNEDECQLYDSKRALAFMLFDASYRAAQHFLYPPIIQHFHGQYILAAASALASLALFGGGSSSSSSITPETSSLLADSTTIAQHHHDQIVMLSGAMEQALVSQLAIIPTLYYPVFFLVTGAVQGLTMEQTIARAKETFIPLMKRNLLFWIPVQFLVFGFVPESLQISVLVVFGLIWTIILSVVAGSVQTSTQPAVVQPAATMAAEIDEEDDLLLVPQTIDKDLEQEIVMAMPVPLQEYEDDEVEVEADVYCVTGMEPNCLIDPDNLFRPPVHYKDKELEAVGAATNTSVAVEEQ